MMSRLYRWHDKTLGLIWINYFTMCGALSAIDAKGRVAKLEHDSNNTERVELLQLNTARQLEVVTDAATNPRDASWFGSFDQGESTFDPAGADYSDRWDMSGFGHHADGPGAQPRLPAAKAIKPELFHESLSAGPNEAWQTNYPSVQGSTAGNRHIRDNPWQATTDSRPDGDNWLQGYVPAQGRRSRAGSVEAEWFDSSVDQLDGFGRRTVPPSGSDRAYPFARKRAVNTTLMCKDPGCSASATLYAFDGAKEVGHNCLLSIGVHATDYDDDTYSEEHVEYLSGNGHVLRRRCWPKARGCNKTAAAPIYPCLESFPVDSLMSNGSLVLQGKITPAVDECPYEGNMFHALAMISCMVQPITTSTTTTTFALLQLQEVNISVPLQCDKPGCTAENFVVFNPVNVFANGGSCFLTFKVNQTDFDGLHGQTEVIEFLQVNGQNLTTNVKPGGNPCFQEYQGNNVSASDRIFTVLKDQDITALVRKAEEGFGRLRITGKISKDVDECGTPYLLDGTAFIRCPVPQNVSGVKAKAAALVDVSGEAVTVENES